MKAEKIQRTLYMKRINGLKTQELLIISRIISEYKRAQIKHPKWPFDLIHGAAIVGEESGELIKAALENHYEPAKADINALWSEGIQTAAMAIRFLVEGMKNGLL